EQLDVGLGRPAQGGGVHPGGEPGDRAGGPQPVHPALDRGRRQPDPPADLRVGRAGVLDQGTHDPLVQFIEGHTAILPNPRSPGGARPGGKAFPGAVSVAYGGRVKGAHGLLGIRLIDVGLAVVVLIAVEISVATGSGPGAAPLNTLAYVLGGVMVLPVLLRNRWPRFELIACSVLLLLYYTFDRRGISPPPLRWPPAYGAAGRRCPRRAAVRPSRAAG